VKHGECKTKGKITPLIIGKMEIESEESRGEVIARLKVLSLALKYRVADGRIFFFIKFRKNDDISMHFHFSLVSLSLQKEEYNENGRL
jgi:hypothetical protein